MLRFAPLVLAFAAVALVASPSAAAPVQPAVKPPSSAKLIRPLTMTVVRNISWGTITVPDGMTYDALVDMSQTGSVFLCGGPLVCSGTYQSARFNIQGTKGAQVRFIARRSLLTNTSSGNGETIEYQPGFNATHTLLYNGAPGNFVDVGGYIRITPTTVDGLYVGIMDVTVDYL